MRPLPLLLALLVVCVPGLAASLAVYGPREIGVPTRLALTFALGSVIPGLLAFLLALAGVLSPATFFPVLGTAVIALLYLAVRKGRPTEHIRAARAEFAAERLPLLTGLAVLAGFAIVRLTFPPTLHFSASASWRYWADALEVADAGAIPGVALQYGTTFPPVTNKVLLSSLGAGLIFTIGREAVPGMAVALWLWSLGLAAALWSLGRELGLRLTAALLPLLVVANTVSLNPELTQDLGSLKAEIAGRLVAFTALAVGVRAIRSREWKDISLSGALFGAAMGIHLVPVLISLVFLASYAVARLIVERDRFLLAIRGASLIGIGIFVGAVILFLPRGDLALGAAAGETPGGFDPTRYLHAGVRTIDTVDSRAWYIAPRRALATYIGTATGVSNKLTRHAWFSIGLAAAGTFLAVAMLRWFPRDLRPIGVAAAGLAAFIVVLTWFLSVRYRLYIPAFFGVRRLMDYSSIPVILVGLAALEAGLSWLARSRPWAPPVVAAALLVAVAAWLIPASRPSSVASAKNRDVVDLFTWVRGNLPCESRILADVHSEGVFQALTGRVSLLEGATPYLRRNVRERVVKLFLDARGFFRDPLANAEFVRRHGVDYLVILRAGRVGYREPIGRVNQSKLQRARFLRLIHSGPGGDVYQVMRTSPPPSLPTAQDFPGYRCERDAVAL
ncbi:MAG TPA: hypothetical protein VHI97_06600 [Actinomycetota bacterium]|nr:hypothetical protein [Actinomycetota bacterium]